MSVLLPKGNGEMYPGGGWRQSVASERRRRGFR
jgi:hypothetical protein